MDGECGSPRPVSRLLLYLDIVSGQKWEGSLVWFLVSQLPGSLVSLSCRSNYRFLFKYNLILWIQYFLLVYNNFNYFTLISCSPILVGIRWPKSTRQLANEWRGSLISSARASHVQTRKKKGVSDLLLGTVLSANRKWLVSDTSIYPSKRETK